MKHKPFWQSWWVPAPMRQVAMDPHQSLTTGGLQEGEGRRAAPYPKKFPSFTWPDMP